MLFPLQFLYILVCWTQTSSPAETSSEPIMSTKNTKKPELRIPMKMLIIPTLEAMSQAMVRDLREKYYKFASDYSKVLTKHLTTETEVTIVNGNLSENDATTLEQLELEFEVLQYKEQIHSLAAPWKCRLNGQPSLPGFSNVLDKTVNKLSMNLRFISLSCKMQSHWKCER